MGKSHTNKKDKKKTKSMTQTKQTLMEKEWNETYLKPFDSTHSAAWQYLSHRFGKKLCHNELMSLAILAGKYNKIPVTREYYRKKKGLILWFETNYNVVVDWMDKNLKAFDMDGKEFRMPAQVC